MIAQIPLEGWALGAEKPTVSNCPQGKSDLQSGSQAGRNRGLKGGTQLFLGLTKRDNVWRRFVSEEITHGWQDCAFDFQNTRRP
jgi:hypothetical protein